MIKDLLKTGIANSLIAVMLFAQTILIARTLGAQGRGEIAHFNAVFTLIVYFFSFGLRQSICESFREKALSQADALNIQILALLVFFFPVLILVTIWTSSLHVSSMYIFLLLISVLSSIITNYSNSFPFFSRDIDQINLNKLITCVITVFCSLLVFIVFNSTQWEHYFFCIALGSLSGALYNLLFVIPRYAINNIDLQRMNVPKTLLLLRRGIWFCLPIIIFQVNFKADIFILKKFSDMSTVGIYAVAVTHAELIWNLTAIMSLVIFSYSVSTKDKKNISLAVISKFKKTMSFLLILIIIYAFILIYFIPFAYGEEFSPSIILSVILLLGTYAICGTQILNADLSGRGNPEIAMWVFSIGAVANILMNYLLIPKYFALGAAVSSVCTYVICSVIFGFLYFKKVSEEI